MNKIGNQIGNLPTMTAFDWGKTTQERNENLEKYHGLQTEEEKVDFLNNLKDPFVVHGTYAWSNACGYEVQLNDSCDAARLRMPDSGKVTDWFEIEWMEDKEWNEACDNGDEPRAVIDPGHYNVPLDLVMRVTLDEDNSWTDPAGGVHYGDDDDPAAMYE